MKILVIGGGGMLGHKMFQTLRRRFGDETWCTLRGTATPATLGICRGADDRVIRADVMDIDALEREITTRRFEAVVNCVGVIKQRSDARVAIPSITINSLLPHRLAACVEPWGGRVIHFSTDCVFSGKRGDYTEADASDAEDLYGKSKFLGEVATENALTLRTSIIGRELSHHKSLLEWFLAQEGITIRGFTRAWWSGVTTNHLADLVADILEHHPRLHGMYQVSGGKIAKYDLLLKIREAYRLDVEIVPDDSFFCDRSLCGDRLREAIGYTAPRYDDQIAQMVADPTPYKLTAPPRRGS